MIEIKRIDASSKQDVRLPNEPFPLFGRMIPSYTDGHWSFTAEHFETVSEMCFPDENYDYDEMSGNSVFLGAYEEGRCIGLAILQQAFFRYMYLYDLKVSKAFRGRGAAGKLIEAAKALAVASGYRGIYTLGQDNNLGACLFYLKSGFHIGGLDTDVYKGTSQEGKADIVFYWDCEGPVSREEDRSR